MTGIGPINPDLPADNYDAVVISDVVVDADPDPITYKLRIKERGGRSGANSQGIDSAERSWEVQGHSSPLICRQALHNAGLTAQSYDDMYLANLIHDQEGPETWIFTGEYDSRTPNVDAGHYTMSIDTTGGSIIQTYAYNQTRYSVSGKVATNHDRAIDVQNGSPKGVSRIIPALKINIRARIATEYLGSGDGIRHQYAKLVASLTGCTNHAPMFDNQYEAGELLFAGATGELTAKNPQLNFTFLASSNATITIGALADIVKGGHEYLSYEFLPDTDSSSKRKTASIVAANVGQIYEPADLTQLSIGVAPS